MTYREAKARVGMRELSLWRRYFRFLDEHPTTDQYYLMQIALEVKRVLHNDPDKICLGDFALVRKTPTPRNQAQVVSSKDCWFAALGGRNKVVDI